MESEMLAGEIRKVPVLDLTAFKSPDDLAITKISSVAALLVPESLMPKVMSIPMANVATMVPIPDGAHAKVHTGEVTLSGEALAAGDPEAYLVVVGLLVATSPVEKVGFRGIVMVGAMLAPEGSETALGPALTSLVGDLSYYPPGAQVKLLSSDVKLSGAELANAGGSAADVLFVAGQALITGPVEKVGYKQVIVAGQLFAPRESQAVLAPYLRVIGKGVYYSGVPRLFTSDERFSKAFFELVKEPIALILNGDATIEADVSAELLQEKVAEIVLNGNLQAPKELLPLLQFLTSEKTGEITALGDE